VNFDAFLPKVAVRVPARKVLFIQVGLHAPSGADPAFTIQGGTIMATIATSNPLHPSMINPPRENEGGPFSNRTNEPGPPREGKTAKAIERQTSQLPSDTFLWAALGSMGVALMLRAANKKDASQFVGQWASPLLLFGVYNKLVKLGGSDRTDPAYGR
jgi:hypothetical protein